MAWDNSWAFLFMNNETILDWSDNMHLKQTKDNVIQMPKNPTHMDFGEWRD